MNCINCKYWQGTKYSKWGDCMRVLFSIEPQLKQCKSTAPGLEGVPMWIPFDPNHMRYFNKNSEILSLLRKVNKHLPDKVRIVRVNKKKFYQTNKNYNCDYYKGT